ncbi:hypothetical protein [Gellertiella hungarica]|uniref:Uncharacterized protein n=1 Tax=Gellertiella hungarica TaxID=1572859 RepID=A0A7W6J8J5_9HYPH|nr:hypothetical protein [Gellertiella hungarica]MBB4066766.1 hypothetical protein [Gellertiella hungarica]
MNIPADGSIIIFDRKINGSYCSEGVAYRVKHYGKRTVDLQDVKTGSHTQEWAHAFARCVWHVAA